MEESLALIVLPVSLEGYALEDQARRLLSIPRVIALEPGRVRTPRLLRDSAALRQARRLRLPGRLAAVILYGPEQYPLARALRALHDEAELWYVAPGSGALDAQSPLAAYDDFARHHAAGVLTPDEQGDVDDGPLRERLLALDVINPHAFVPSARMGRARRRRKGSESRR